jgi:hypothetical protein
MAAPISHLTRQFVHQRLSHEISRLNGNIVKIVIAEAPNTGFEKGVLALKFAGGPSNGQRSSRRVLIALEPRSKEGRTHEDRNRI